MRTKLLLNIAIPFLLYSCGLKPIPSEYDLTKVESENVAISNLGNGRVLIYSDANILHTADNTSRLNFILDEKNLGQLRAKGFAIVHLADGEHTFKLKHKDLVNMRSEHEVVINDTVKVIRVKPTITSNKLEITNKLTSNWEKYRYMKTN